jgi:sirohydrochlorin cobaltochelatase
MKKHVLVISHGSRETSANQDFKKLVQKYRHKHPSWVIAYAFLELTEPSIPEALEKLSKKSDEILILPLFLFAAKHVKKHIPEILKVFRKNHPKVKVALGKPLGSDLKLLNILDQRLQQLL